MALVDTSGSEEQTDESVVKIECDNLTSSATYYLGPDDTLEVRDDDPNRVAVTPLVTDGEQDEAPVTQDVGAAGSNQEKVERARRLLAEVYSDIGEPANGFFWPAFSQLEARLAVLEDSRKEGDQ